MLRALPVLREIRDVDGWLSEDEADLLLAACARAVAQSPGGAVVEIGSYCGRSTIVLASVLAAGRTPGRVVAIDPHEGEVMAYDGRIMSMPPTLERFEANIERAGLRDFVLTMPRRSYEVRWNDPIAFLFIDGLHDRENVERDFRHFESHLVRGGFVGFHDYSPYHPEVVEFVEGLVAGGGYARVDQAESLVVLTPG